MQKLAKREEQIMQACWRLSVAFVKEIIAELPDPKPHYNSVATMVRILEDKGFLGHETFGNTFRYFPVISKEQYQKHAMEDIVSKYFNNSSYHAGLFREGTANFPGRNERNIRDHQIQEEMIPYILDVTVILTVCFLFYKLFLQKATFYGLNRWAGCDWSGRPQDRRTIFEVLEKARASGMPARFAVYLP